MSSIFTYQYLITFRIHLSFYHFIFIILRGCLRFHFLHIHPGETSSSYPRYIHPGNIVFISSLHSSGEHRLHILVTYPRYICSLHSSGGNIVFISSLHSSGGNIAFIYSLHSRQENTSFICSLSLATQF